MTLNPYQAPKSDVPSLALTTDASRESLTATINAFLASEITAFDFDERLDAFRESDDPVIQHVVDAVWYHYDDCDDHLVCLSKPEWDYFQRLLLVLNSHSKVETQTERCWSRKQIIAALSLCGFTLCALQTGWGHHLFILAIPFGVISIALSFWHSRAESGNGPYDPIIFPFATFADLATAYRSSTFRKTRFPKHLDGRRIRSPFMAVFWQLHAYTMWLILSPFPLLFQTFPERQTQTRIVAG